MKAMTCELCGGNEIVKQDGFFVCQHCGTKYSLEEARKIIGTVTIDKSKELENLYQLARRAKSNNDSADASKYYDMILLQDPNSWEAAFYFAYFRAIHYSVTDIVEGAEKVISAIKTVTMLAGSVEDKEEIDRILVQISLRLILLAKTLASKSFSIYNTPIELKDRDGKLVVALSAVHDLLFRSAQILSNSLLAQSNVGKKSLVNLYKQSLITLYSHAPFRVRRTKIAKDEFNNLRILDPAYKIPKRKAKHLATHV